MSSEPQERCAIIGLGLIGSSWATHLEHDGLLAAAWNRTAKQNTPRFVAPLHEIPRRADILHLVVSDELVAQEIVHQICQELAARHLVIQSTTIDPDTSAQLRAAVTATGAGYLEAPFTGSLPAAQNRKVIFYLGGDSATVSRALPYLNRLSSKQIVIGDHRQACTLKLAMNLQIVSITAALCEALSIARAQGISDAIFFDAMRENAAWSGVAALKEHKLRAEDFSAQFSMKHMAKDMRLLAATATGTPQPMLTTVRQILAEASAQGLSELDFSSIIKRLT